MEEVPCSHQTEGVVSRHNDVPLRDQDSFGFSKYCVRIIHKFNYMWKEYNVNAI